MKKRTIFGLATTTVLLLTIVGLVSTRGSMVEESDTAAAQQETRTKKYRDALTENEAARIRRKNMARKIKAAIALNADRYAEEEIEEETSSSSLSKKEIARRNIRNSVVGPLASAEAPGIYERMINEQREDTAWTNEVKQKFDAILERSTSDGTVTVEASCFQKLCRGKFVHKNRESMYAFMGETQNGPIDGSSNGFVNTNDDGSIENIVYFGRKESETSIVEEMFDRLYEATTGKSAQSIEVTDQQLVQFSMLEKNLALKDNE